MHETAVDVAGGYVKLANIGRRIGIMLQALCKHDQISFAFFQAFDGQLPKGMDYNAAKKCVKLANAMPDEAKTVDDIRKAAQLCFEITGITDEPKRLEQQISREVSPVVFFNTVFSDIRVKVYEKIASWNSWDDMTRESVKTEIARAEKWISDIKARLN